MAMHPVDTVRESRFAGYLSEWTITYVLVLVGIGLRVFQLSRPGHLFGLTEYDDGVYFGSALRLIQGVFPYRDFVLVQPPGIAVLLSPWAFASKFFGTDYGIASARLLTVLVSGVNIALVGRLIRHQGKVATLVACGFIALYPDAIAASQTVLLEPYLNLFCLLGAVIIFDGGRFRWSTWHLFFGAFLFGVAGAIKTWAVLPVIVVLVTGLFSFPRKSKYGARLAALVSGVILGFTVLAGPFIALAPSKFFKDVIYAQLFRASGQRVDLGVRLQNITGSGPLIWLLGNQGRSVILVLSTGVLVAILLVGVIRIVNGGSEFEVFTIVTTVVVTIALLWPSDFYYHYAAFLGPFLALSVALVLGRCDFGFIWRPANSESVFRELAITATMLTGLGLVQFLNEGALQPSYAPGAVVSKIIPSGACVVTDEASLTILSNRFISTEKNCPNLVDPYGVALALSGGKTIDGGASRDLLVDSAWLSDLQRAKYVWLSPQNSRRLPWVSSTKTYFGIYFAKLTTPSLKVGTLYVRVGKKAT